MKRAGIQTWSRKSAGGSSCSARTWMNGTQIVVAVDERLEHRAEARVGIGDPGECARRPSRPAVSGAASNAASRSSRGLRRPVRWRAARVASISSGSHGPGSPSTVGERSPRNTLSRSISQRMAAGRPAPSAPRRIEFRRDGELRQRPLPVAEHAEQLEQEGAQPRIARAPCAPPASAGPARPATSPDRKLSRASKGAGLPRAR